MDKTVETLNKKVNRDQTTQSPQDSHGCYEHPDAQPFAKKDDMDALSGMLAMLPRWAGQVFAPALFGPVRSAFTDPNHAIAAAVTGAVVVQVLAIFVVLSGRIRSLLQENRF
ncbi:hypothetical protein [Pseudomonas sp. NFACC45]|uniref:hypothetical protein n=1 Tax=Pseudomonas sp. NFACC45 TaxID=1566201 RepID=UPI00210C7B4E|nr:hypothetical protein [Pseudomonas sp. NFACC45]